MTEVRSKEQGARSKNGSPGSAPGAPGYRRLIAFNKSDELAKRLYRLSRKVAERDRWLANQLSRAAVSAPLNIVEGHGRGTLKDFLRFLETASASLNEVEYLLSFMRDAGLLTHSDLAPIEPIRREAAATLTGLIKALRKKAEVQKDWNRNLISDEHGEYFTGSVDETDLLATGSLLLAPRPGDGLEED